MKTAQPGIMDIILRPFIGFADTFFGYFKNRTTQTTPEEQNEHSSSDEAILKILQDNSALMDASRNLIPVLHTYKEVIKTESLIRQQIIEMKELIAEIHGVVGEIDAFQSSQRTQQKVRAILNDIRAREEAHLVSELSHSKERVLSTSVQVNQKTSEAKTLTQEVLATVREIDQRLEQLKALETSAVTQDADSLANESLVQRFRRIHSQNAAYLEEALQKDRDLEPIRMMYRTQANTDAEETENHPHSSFPSN